MPNKRDYNRYVLKSGKKTVYVGITNDFERREKEHKETGNDFSSIVKVGPKVTKKSAEQWEEDKLDTYSKNHNGKGPKYNKTKK